MQKLCLQYQNEKNLDNGELILLNFRSLLLDIVQKSLQKNLNYAEIKTFTSDIHMPALKVSNGGLTIRLIINTDEALVCKLPLYSAGPVFSAVADLPLVAKSKLLKVKQLNGYY